MSYEIRTFGDPVLKTKAAQVTEITGKVRQLVDDMFDTLYDSDTGLALAAPQIGVQKQVIVWDIDDEQLLAVLYHHRGGLAARTPDTRAMAATA